jgi:class 3 adenylate cyclase/CHASE2 domain-containing sensor protein
LKLLIKPIIRFLRRLRENIWLSGAFISLLSSGFTLAVIENLSLATLAENHLTDVRVVMLSLPRPQSRNIAIVLVTDETLADYPYRSPLDRLLIANLLDELEQRSVAAIGINVLFDRPTEPDKDRILYDRLRKLEVPVILSKVSTTSGFSAEQVTFSNYFLKNIPTGLSLIYRDPVDHTIRGSLMKLIQGRKIHLGFSATIADALGFDLPEEERLFIDYRPGPDIETPPFPIYAAHDVPRLPSGALENRIVLIGSDLGDSTRLRTPLSVLESGFSRDLPGVVIEAHILSQLIENRRMKVPTAQENMIFVLLMAILGCAVSLLRVKLLFKLLISLTLLPLAWIAAFSMYITQQAMLPMVTPTFAFIVALVLSAFWQWWTEFQMRERIHHAFGRFLAPTVVEQIMLNPDELELGGEVREITFLFTDLEGFTRLTESTPPQQMVRLVNQYLEEACDIVIEYGGTIDKIVGDALHVMFNAPLLQSDHAQRAVECAMAIDQWSARFRQRVEQEGIDLGVTRIGVNTGKCIVGNFGGKRRFDYTAHGDAINTAARLEAINQRLGTTICVSETTANQCHEVVFRPLATLVLRGKTKELKTYLPVADEDVDDKLLEQYEKAYQALSVDDPEARHLIEMLETKYPNDPLVKLHARRIEAGESGTTLIIRKK